MSNINFNVALGGQSHKDYKFRDATFQISHENRDISDARDLNAIRQGIYNLFHWTPGQRIILPEFPGNLLRFRYEQISNTTTQNIYNEIIRMFEEWEPRVSIEKIDVTPVEDQHLYLIYIEYSVPSLAKDRYEISSELKINY